MNTDTPCIAFEDRRRIASGPLADVARAVKVVADARPLARILVFNAHTSEPIELDCRGSVEQMLQAFDATRAPPARAKPAPPERNGPGRPRLGVVAREVTLLPRHWEWLASQPGGASVALRKLVEQAKRSNAAADRRRQAQNASYQFMSVMAGDLDRFEEAARALFAADRERFAELIAGWPHDVGGHLRQLAAAAFADDTDEANGDA